MGQSKQAAALLLLTGMIPAIDANRDVLAVWSPKLLYFLWVLYVVDDGQVEQL